MNLPEEIEGNRVILIKVPCGCLSYCTGNDGKIRPFIELRKKVGGIETIAVPSFGFNNKGHTISRRSKDIPVYPKGEWVVPHLKNCLDSVISEYKKKNNSVPGRVCLHVICAMDFYPEIAICSDDSGAELEVYPTLDNIPIKDIRYCYSKELRR